MWTALLDVIGTFAKIYELHEVQKYADRIRSLQLAIDEEQNKPIDQVVDVRIEAMERQLKIEQVALLNAASSIKK